MTSSEQDRDNLYDPTEFVRELQKHVPDDWEDPRVKIAHTAILLPGILPAMINRTPELLPVLTDFFVGKTDLLFIGGESGMGKSLLASEIRFLNGALHHVFPEKLRHRLTAISWDRTHRIFYDQLSLQHTTTIDTPQGITPESGRIEVSNGLEFAVRFAARRYPGAKILVETPLFGNRGEALYHLLPEFNDRTRTIIMHSPEERARTLKGKTRLMSTAGPYQSMVQNRSFLMEEIAPSGKRMSQDAQDEQIRKRWQFFLKDHPGIVVRWNPEDDPSGFQGTVRRLRSQDIRTDVIDPKIIGKFIGNYFDQAFTTIPNFDGFLHRMIAAS